MAIAGKPAPRRPEFGAEEVAKSLAAVFLERGNYEALGSPLSDRSVAEFASPAATAAVERTYDAEEGFAGLAVQSVAYTAGAERERVIIYVTKGSTRALRQLPDRVEGVPVEARLMGKPRASPAPAMATMGNSEFYERNNRIACGSSVAPSREQYAGTLGAFATGGGRTFALSNNHVFAACNHTAVGMPILSPASADARAGRRAPTSVCVYQDMVELRSGVPALVQPMNFDAAFGEVTNPALISSWQGDAVNGYDTPSAVVSPASGMRVKKFGRTTGFSTGIVEALAPTPWVMPYRWPRFTAEVWFAYTWTVLSDGPDPFALAGDSGSLVVTADGSAAVGQVFAANPKGTYGIMYPIDAVLARFGNLDLLHGHGL